MPVAGARFAGAMAACALCAAAGDARAGEAGFWDRVADPHRERFEALVSSAAIAIEVAVNQPVAGGRGAPSHAPAMPVAVSVARAEMLLEEALKLVKDDYRALALLGEAQSLLERPVEATATLERAREVARLPARQAWCSFRLGVEKSKLGRYADALADYDRQLRLVGVPSEVGGSLATAYANSAELLMTLGRLTEAQDRYREAIRWDEQDRQARQPSLALSYYGLAMALDRDEQPAAAREAMRGALALDPAMDRLYGAMSSGSDVFFIPDGDVHDYLALALETAGRPREAAAELRRYLAAQPKSPWRARAESRLAALSSGAGSAPLPAAGDAGVATRLGTETGAGTLRIKAVSTLRASGPLPAPLIDAAWRARPPPVADCLDLMSARLPSSGRGADGGRVVLDVELDAAGSVARVAARPAAGAPTSLLPTAAASCLESAVRRGLHVTKPARARRTVARIELYVAP